LENTPYKSFVSLSLWRQSKSQSTRPEQRVANASKTLHLVKKLHTKNNANQLRNYSVEMDRIS